MQRWPCMDEWRRSGGSTPLLRSDRRSWRFRADQCAARGISNRRLARKLESGTRGTCPRRGEPKNDQAALLRRSDHDSKKSRSEGKRQSHRQFSTLCTIEGRPCLARGSINNPKATACAASCCAGLRAVFTFTLSAFPDRGVEPTGKYSDTCGLYLTP